MKPFQPDSWGPPRAASEPRDPVQGRFVELDSLRGLAALAVLGVHFTTEYDSFYQSAHPFPLPFRWGGLGVHMFFLISGFVIFATTRRHSRPSSFIAARAIRLFPAYWACVTLTALSTLAWNRYAQPWPTVAVNFTMVQSFLRVRDLDGAYWSLAREISFYALITALLWLFRGRISLRVVTVATWAWTCAGIALGVIFHLTQSHAVDLLTRALAAEYAPLFGLGMLLTLVRSGQRRLGADLAALAVCAGLTHVLMTQNIEESCLITFLIIPVFTLVCVRPQTPILRWRVLVWFGTVSYPLYLLHQNIGHAIIHATLPHLGVVASRGVAFVTVVFLAWAVHVAMEEHLGKRLRRLIPDSSPKDLK